MDIKKARLEEARRRAVEISTYESTKAQYHEGFWDHSIVIRSLVKILEDINWQPPEDPEERNAYHMFKALNTSVNIEFPDRDCLYGWEQFWSGWQEAKKEQK